MFLSDDLLVDVPSRDEMDLTIKAGLIFYSIILETSLWALMSICRSKFLWGRKYTSCSNWSTFKCYHCWLLRWPKDSLWFLKHGFLEVSPPMNQMSDCWLVCWSFGWSVVGWSVFSRSARCYTSMLLLEHLFISKSKAYVVETIKYICNILSNNITNTASRRTACQPRVTADQPDQPQSCRYHGTAGVPWDQKGSAGVPWDQKGAGGVLF